MLSLFTWPQPTGQDIRSAPPTWPSQRTGPSPLRCVVVIAGHQWSGSGGLFLHQHLGQWSSLPFTVGAGVSSCSILETLNCMGASYVYIRRDVSRRRATRYSMLPLWLRHPLCYCSSSPINGCWGGIAPLEFALIHSHGRLPLLGFNVDAHPVTEQVRETV